MPLLLRGEAAANSSLPGQDMFNHVIENIAGHYNASTDANRPLYLLLIQDPMLQSILYTIIVDLAFLGLIYLVVFYVFKKCTKVQTNQASIRFDRAAA